MKTLILFIISVNIVFAQKTMFDPNEAESLSNLYKQLDGKNWQWNTWGEISKDKIYSNKSEMNFIGINSIYLKDTTIDNETIKVYTLSEINIGLAIGRPKINNLRIQGGNIPKCYFPNLEKFTLFNVNGTFGLEHISFPNLKELYLNDCFIWGELDLNSMPNLEIVDIYRAEIDVNLSNLSLPKCKTFKLIGTKLKQILTIENMQRAEIFKIKEWFEHEWNYQEPGEFSLYGSDIKEIKKLTNSKEISICYAAITGELDTLELEHLEKLELYANGIKGAFPEFKCPKLIHIDFQGNYLTHFNKGIDNDNLKYLNLYGNKLKGEIPKFKTPNLEKLNMSANQLSSGLENILISNRFTFIDLSGNSFEQEINFDIIAPNLECLKLTGNKLYGNVPKIDCENMFYLDLSRNKFTKITNDLNVQSETVIDISNNLIRYWDIAERCENFPEELKSKKDVLSNPKHIFEYFFVYDIEKWFEYSGSDIEFYGKIESGFSDEYRYKIYYNFDESRIFTDFIDTANYNYEIHKYSGWKNEKISDNIYYKINEYGRYHIEIKSKYCDVTARTEFIDIQQLSIENNDNISIYKKDEELIIDNLQNELIQQLNVYDLLGNEVYKSQEALTNNKRIELKNPNQPLFIRMLINNEWIIKKVI